MEKTRNTLCGQRNKKAEIEYCVLFTVMSDWDGKQALGGPSVQLQK